MFEQATATIREGIENLSIPVDGTALIESIGLLDRHEARVLDALGAFNAAEGWRCDDATSLTAWLQTHAGRSQRQAAGWSKTAKPIGELPVLAGAYRDGSLSAGQLQAIVANISDKTVSLFADQEQQIVPDLLPLPVADVATAMQRWAQAAKDALQPDPAENPNRNCPSAAFTCPAPSAAAANCPAASTPKPAPSRRPRCASPPPTTPTANRLAPRPSDAPMRSPTSSATSWTTRTTTGSADATTSTSSSTTTTSSTPPAPTLTATRPPAPPGPGNLPARTGRATATALAAGRGPRGPPTRTVAHPRAAAPVPPPGPRDPPIGPAVHPPMQPAQGRGPWRPFT